MGKHSQGAIDNASINAAERAIDSAFATGKADRAVITRQAQADANEAVQKVGVAIQSDEEADEAARFAVIAANMGNRDNVKKARANERAARTQAKRDHRAATKSARQAYRAIKFSDPSKLGFVRVVQFLFLMHIAFTLLQLILTTRDTVVYSSANFSTWINVVLESVAFYFFVNRYKIGRPFVIGMSVVNIVLNVVAAVMDGGLTLSRLLNDNYFYVILIFYFAFSEHVKTVLVNDLAHDRGALDSADLVIDRKSWAFYRNLIMYFFVFSVLGHWMEASFCQLIRLGIVQGDYDATNTMLWRDWFYPYPMHGTAVILIAVILYPLFTTLRKRINNKFLPYVLSFLINMLTCTAIEFVGGLLFNADLQNWNYSDLPFNFMGQVCLQNAIGFGIASSIIAWWVYPMMERMIARVRPSIMNIACVVIAVAGGLLFSLYAISPPQGVDFGEGGSAEYRRQAEIERDSILLEVRGTEAQLQSLRNALDTSLFLPMEDRNAALSELSQIEQEVAALHSRLENAQYVSEELADAIDEATFVSTEYRRESEGSASAEAEAGTPAEEPAATEPAPTEEATPATE